MDLLSNGDVGGASGGTDVNENLLIPYFIQQYEYSEYNNFLSTVV